MKAIDPSSRPSLGQTYSYKGRTQKRSETADTEKSSKSRERRRGPRRNNLNRMGGRRASDHMVRWAAPSWVQAEFTAHLIGQVPTVSERVDSARRAYAAAGKLGRS